MDRRALSECTESELALLLRDELDGQAFGELAGRCRRRLVRAVEGVMGAGPEVEDVLQVALLAAWRHRDRFDPSRAQFCTWVYAIARRAAITHLRGMPPPAPPSAELVRQRDPADEIVHRQIALALLSALPPVHREAVFLQSEGFTYAEIAQMTGAPIGTVKARVSRGRQALIKLAQQWGLTDAEG